MTKKRESEASTLMWQHLKELQIEFPINIYREFRFHLDRKWRFDFAVIEHKDLQGEGGIAVEIDGGSWIQGRHNTGSGSAKDREKFNEAARLKWRVLKFTPIEVKRGQALDFIKRVLQSTCAGVVPQAERSTPQGHQPKRDQ